MSSVAKKTGKNSIEDKMYRQSRIFYQILKYVFLTMCCLMVIIPLIVVLIGAFKTHDEYISTGVFTLPEVPQFENFKIAFVNGKVMQGLLNTLIILAVSCFGTIFTGTMTAFVLQRFNMLFTRAVKMVFLIAALLPNISMQVTVFQIVSKLGLYNTLAAPCILYIGTDIISIYIFIQFLNNISKSLDESAIPRRCELSAGILQHYPSYAETRDSYRAGHQVRIHLQRLLHREPLHAQPGSCGSIDGAVPLHWSA